MPLRFGFPPIRAGSFADAAVAPASRIAAMPAASFQNRPIPCPSSPLVPLCGKRICNYLAAGIDGDILFAAAAPIAHRIGIGAVAEPGFPQLLAGGGIERPEPLVVGRA